MKLTGSYTVAAPPERVFAALIDPAVLQRTLPGCEALTKVGDDQYDACVKIGVAGLKGTYTGRAEIRDRQPPQSFTLLVDGKGSPGFVRSTARIALSAVDEGTRVECDADVQVGGLIAAVGSRLVEAAGRKQMDDFFRQLAADLAQDD